MVAATKSRDADFSWSRSQELIGNSEYKDQEGTHGSNQPKIKVHGKAGGDKDRHPRGVAKRNQSGACHELANGVEVAERLGMAGARLRDRALEDGAK